jgi:Spy/CpxP family protein refolding chaperone
MKYLLAALLLAANTAVFAQAPQGDAGKAKPRRFDCSQAKDPKACEENVKKLREAHAKARAACDAKPADEKRECMRREMCAQSSDPAKCEARAKEATARRAQVREACKGKAGDELKACIREQRAKAGADKKPGEKK